MRSRPARFSTGARAGVFVTDRFLRDERRSSYQLAALASSEVRHVLAVRRSGPAWRGQFDRHASFDGTPSPLEIDIGGGKRMLAWSGDEGGRGDDLTFLGFGEKTWFYSYRSRQLAADLLTRSPMPERLLPGGPALLRTSGAETLTPFANETEPEWLYFLSEQQEAVADAIVESAFDAVTDEREPPSLHFVVGGPGTGKTCVLLQVYRQLWGLGLVAVRDVRLETSDLVADYLAASTGMDAVDLKRRHASDASIPVRLVDDPDDRASIEAAVADARVRGARAVVIGFDPLQLRESMTDTQYKAIIRSSAVTEHRLNVCYRQKAEVGKVAHRVVTTVASSSPFLDQAKKKNFKAKHRDLTRTSNDMEFANPSGRQLLFEKADLPTWQSHFRWLAQQRLWRHFSPILVVQDDEVTVPDEFRREAHRLRSRWILLSETGQVKGAEFQHLVLLLTDKRYRDINDGFTGSGQAKYNQYRLLRIPFTRPKDSIAAFVVT